MTKDAPETAIDSEDCIKLGVPPKSKPKAAPSKNNHELTAAIQTKDYHYVYSIYDSIGLS